MNDYTHRDLKEFMLWANYLPTIIPSIILKIKRFCNKILQKIRKFLAKH